MELRARASAALQAIEDATAERIADVIDHVISALAAYLEANPEADPVNLAEVLSALIEQGAQAGADFMVPMAETVIDVSSTTQARISSMFGVTTANEAVMSAAVWSDQYRLDLLREGHQLWYERIKNDALHPKGALRDAMEAANVWGESLNDAATRLVRADPGFTRLPPLSMDPMARARMIVRTESTRFDNAVSVSMAEQSGLTKFLNIGVGDKRQSDICQKASLAGPRTVEEWKQAEGMAPRHPNCRCSMIGVDDGFSPSKEQKQKSGVVA
jgi:hypothetical protein